MSRPTLAARNRRALRLGTIITAPILLYAFALRPVANNLTAQAEAIERERDLLQRERVLLASAVEYPTRMLTAEQTLAGQRPRGFTGPDPVASTALLAGYAADLASENDVRVDRTDTRSPDEADAAIELRVTLTATGDIHGVMHFLRSLESGPRMVIVERFAVRADGIGASGYPSGPPGSGTELLEVTLDLLGFASGMEERS